MKARKSHSGVDIAGSYLRALLDGNSRGFLFLAVRRLFEGRRIFYENATSLRLVRTGAACNAPLMRRYRMVDQLAEFYPQLRAPVLGYCHTRRSP